MVTKLYDLAVPVSKYTTRDGQEKTHYENVGSVMKGDNGSYIMLKRSFNPAGVPFKEGSDCIIVSIFPSKTPNENERTEQNARSSQFSNEPRHDFDRNAQFGNSSDCPF